MQLVTHWSVAVSCRRRPGWGKCGRPSFEHDSATSGDAICTLGGLYVLVSNRKRQA